MPVSRFTRELVENAKRTPWWGLSALVHALLLYILALWPVPQRAPEEILRAIAVGIMPPPEEPLPLDTKIIPPQPPAEPPLKEPETREIVDAEAIAELERFEKARVFYVEDPLAGRSARGRKAAIERGEATTPSENAVELGLLWLASKQLRTGGWRTDRDASRWADPGITGLATLAFLGAGYTQQRGRYARTVRAALGYIKRQQDTEGCIALTVDGTRVGVYMYCHGICALALAEAYHMTKDPLLREPAQRAIDFICETQNSTGGWRYYGTSSDADSSVSGWMVMALRSAKLAGLDVPKKAFDGARKFFNSVTDKETGATVYMRGLRPSSAALIAVGLLCNQYLGLKGDDPYIKRAGALINKFAPKWVPARDGVTIRTLPSTNPGANNFYYWYYANLALHQRRDDAWEKWHPQVRELLVKAQERKGTDEGSWPPISYWASVRGGGRVYATALAILALEVYYRYAPLYREVVDEVLAAYGDALSAYNRFARLAAAGRRQAGQAQKAAIEKIKKFLVLSEPKSGKQLPRASLTRRGKAGMMLFRLHRMADEHEEAIALLETFPQRFPGGLDDGERRKLLADSYRAYSWQLARAGRQGRAKQAEGKALDLYYPLAAASLGKNPQLEAWLAARLFQREEWRKALVLYKAQGKRLWSKKIKPKSPKAQKAAAIYRRMAHCYAHLQLYKSASRALDRIEKLLGPSLALRRERAALHRKRKSYSAARKIYQSILQRVPRYSETWWETRYDELLMAFYEGRRQYVARTVAKLQVMHPELGGEELRPRFLKLCRLAQKGN